jgi:hypothetical protein
MDMHWFKSGFLGTPSCLSTMSYHGFCGLAFWGAERL